MRINMLDLKREASEMGHEIYEAVGQPFNDTMFINGPRVKRFEKVAADYLGVKHAIGVGNGTDALVLALLSAGIKSGDEVITTANTFFATVEACVHVGATPVFVDIDEATLNINPALIEKSITPKTKCILPVHIFGLPCDMDAIRKIACSHNLIIVEDCAQCFGSEIGGKKTGTFGVAGTTSFYPTKNLGAYGDGGMVFTDDDVIAETVRILKEHGSIEKYYNTLVGYNSRLDDIQASILNVKIKYIDDFNLRRRRIADKYRCILGDKVKYQEGSGNIYHQFTIRVKNRAKIIETLNAAEIGSSIFYPIPCHLQDAVAFLGWKKGDLPVTEMVSDEVLSIPVHPYLEDTEITEVGETILKAL